MKLHTKNALIGFCAGSVNGLLGTGGGLILIPLLSRFSDLQEEEVFPSSLAVILPISAVSLAWTLFSTSVNFTEALPYLFGSIIGGYFAGRFGNKISPTLLHRLLGILILWGGIRYLC